MTIILRDNSEGRGERRDFFLVCTVIMVGIKCSSFNYFGFVVSCHAF